MTIRKCSKCGNITDIAIKRTICFECYEKELKEDWEKQVEYWEKQIRVAKRYLKIAKEELKKEDKNV